MSIPLKLSEEDLKKLVSLVLRAQNTPAIALSSEDAINGKDWASLAWADVREFQKELGKKYEYEWTKKAIKSDTGEVLDFER